MATKKTTAKRTSVPSGAKSAKKVANKKAKSNAATTSTSNKQVKAASASHTATVKNKKASATSPKTTLKKAVKSPVKAIKGVNIKKKNITKKSEVIKASSKVKASKKAAGKPVNKNVNKEGKKALSKKKITKTDNKKTLSKAVVSSKTTSKKKLVNAAATTGKLSKGAVKAVPKKSKDSLKKMDTLKKTLKPNLVNKASVEEPVAKPAAGVPSRKSTLGTRGRKASEPAVTKHVIALHNTKIKKSEIPEENHERVMTEFKPRGRSVLDDVDENAGPAYRYSDEDLNEFKDLIFNRLENARKELVYLQGLITRKDDAGTEDTDNRFNHMEDGSGAMEREQLSQLAGRQIQFIRHLENALVRIENKTYGICRVTGKLISKARLRAVPHATLSIEAKRGLKK